MRSLLYSDLHLDDNSANTVFNEVFPGILELAREHKCQSVYCLGDFWHMRYRVPVKLLNAATKFLFECSDQGLETTLLPGNHDQIDAEGRNALEVFDHIPRCDVLTQPSIRSSGCWMPYRPALEVVMENLRLLAAETMPKRWLYLHYGVRGALQNNVTEDTDGLLANVFEEMGFDRVICGHYHKPQVLAGGLVQYLGSPYQTRADEAGQEKGVYILDGDDLTFLPQNWGRKFRKVTIQSWMQLESFIHEQKPDSMDDIRVTLDCQDIEPQAAHAWMREKGLQNVIITPVVHTFERRLDIKEDASIVDYARAYMQANTYPEEMGMPHSQLWKTFERIRADAKPVQGGGVL